MRILARGKICWTLDILEELPNGYHKLDMLLQSVNEADVLTITPSDELTLKIAGQPYLKADESNLVLRAAKALQKETGCQKGASVFLEKHLPMGAGMGGGSADAAGALLGLNALWQLHVPMEKLLQIGLGLGTDVPFCLQGGLMHAQGIGEILTPVPCARLYWLAVVQPCRGLSTKQVYDALSLKDIAPGERPHNANALAALESGNTALLCASLGNVLQKVSSAMLPPIQSAIDDLQKQGAMAAEMTGSGSAVFGVFSSAPQARSAVNALRSKYPVCFMTGTSLSGCEITE